MICNSNITIYHKGFNKNTKLETWTRYNYDNVWFYGGKGAGLNRGYENANDFDCRIPYNDDLDIKNFSIGDIVVNEKLNIDIETQQDLSKHQIFNIRSINNNNFGNNQHIHIGGK